MGSVVERRPLTKTSLDLGIEAAAADCDFLLRDAHCWASADLGRTRMVVTVHVVSDQFVDSDSPLNLLGFGSGCLAVALQDFARRNSRGR